MIWATQKIKKGMPKTTSLGKKEKNETSTKENLKKNSKGIKTVSAEKDKIWRIHI